MDKRYDLLAEALIRAVFKRETASLTLPGVLAALMRDAVASFPALRPHQRHAWHAFLVQVGALALLRAGLHDPPVDESAWRDLLRGLTPDFPDDEPWSLVAPPGRPALLQAPLPGGLKDLKNRIETPDALDMLVTAKNHDLKSEVMAQAGADEWLFALVTLQTMEGFLGAGNYGISRMNGGFANRPALGLAPPGGPGAHVRRDLLRLLELRRAGKVQPGFAPSGGIGLVWLAPWDGASSLRPTDLDPIYVEICRRVRLAEANGRLVALAGGSKAARIAGFEKGGVTGDPWTPVVVDKDGSRRVLTVDASGFSYRRMVRLMFGAKGEAVTYEPSPLQALAPDDAHQGLALVARALTRGQGKTEGYHERRVPISGRVGGLLRGGDADPIARAAEKRVQLAGEMQNRVLKAALYALFENGPDAIDFKDAGAERRATAFLARFDGAVDRTFFPDLWDEFEDGADWQAVRAAWVRGLRDQAFALLGEADRGASKAIGRRYRALARAEAVFHGALRRNDHLREFFPETPRVDAA